MGCPRSDFMGLGHCGVIGESYGIPRALCSGMSMFKSTPPQEVLVRDVMISSPISVEPTTSVHEALRISAQRGIHHFPVCRDGKLVGFVCTCDLERAPRDESLERYLRTGVTVAADSTARAAARIMEECQIGSLLVVREAELVGIVTRDDLARHGSASVVFTHCHRCGNHHGLRRTHGGLFLCEECARHRPAHVMAPHVAAAEEEVAFGD